MMSNSNMVRTGKLDKWIRPVVLLLVAMVLFLCLPVLPAGAVNYYSLYSFGRPINYCSQQSCSPGEDDCQPCTQGAEIYRHTERMIGFKDMYNPHDPRTTCGSATDVSCVGSELTLSLNLTAMTSVVKAADLAGFPDGFRFYLPPGTVYASATVYTPRDTKEGMVVRFGQPPTCEFCQYAWQAYYYDQVPWKPYTQVGLADLQKGDVYMSTLGGHAEVLPTLARQQPLSESEAGWIYIQRLPFTGDDIYAVQVTIRVDTQAYTRWYDSYNGWDAGGDPWSSAGSVTPTPGPACSLSNLGDCGTMDQCEGVGAYWYDDTCNPEPICDQNSLNNCTSEGDCVGSGFYWYDNVCNPEPRCRADNPAGCESKTECETIEKYWYDNACYAGPACAVGSLSRCMTAEQCTTSGFHWDDDNSCQLTPPCGADYLEACVEEDDCLGAGGDWDSGSCRGWGCSPTNLGSCDDYLSCTQQGGVWYSDKKTCNQPQCGPYELTSCLTLADCSEAGGIWDGHRCQDAASSQSCSPANLAACTDAIHCGLVNGFWNGNSCVSSSSGGSSGGGTTPVVDTCNASHLDLCTAEVDCIGAGGNWDGQSCVDNSGGSQSGDCDISHRTSCMNEQSCDGARGFWYDNSCHIAPAPKVVPKTQEIVDYNNRLGEAYVQLGAGALDGELNAGDLLELQLNFPSSTRSVSRYGGIMIGDEQLYFIRNQGGDLLSPEVSPLEGDNFAALDQSLLLVPWDVCASLGSEYQGDWIVYFFTVDSSSSFQDLAGLQQSLAGSSYYLGWYKIKVDCSKQAPAPVLAAPPEAMAAVTGEVQPGATVVPVVAGPLLLQPTLAVVPEDVGVQATLFATVSLPGSNATFNFPGPTVTLDTEENFSQVFPNAINFTGQHNQVFDVYFGYVLADGTRKFNAYEVKIQ
jgi:hypothetical protein